MSDKKRVLISQHWTMVEIIQLSDTFTKIVDATTMHRPWFDDHTWADDWGRRVAVVRHLREAAEEGSLWVVWDGAKPVGIVLLNHVRHGIEAYAHFVFFDRKLADKKDVCLDLLSLAFERFELHRVSVEVPTYAAILASWLRKRLGFRYEVEGRKIAWPKELRRSKDRTELARLLRRNDAAVAAWASRRYQAVLYKGEWHDVLLLSLTREEFYDGRVQTRHQTGGHQAAGLGKEDGVRTGELHGGSAEPVQGSRELPERGAETVPERVHPPNPWGSTGDVPEGD